MIKNYFIGAGEVIVTEKYYSSFRPQKLTARTKFANISL